jgi:hypothetical protein
MATALQHAALLALAGSRQHYIGTATFSALASLPALLQRTLPRQPDAHAIIEIQPTQSLEFRWIIQFEHRFIASLHVTCDWEQSLRLIGCLALERSSCWRAVEAQLRRRQWLAIYLLIALQCGTPAVQAIDAALARLQLKI